MNSKTFRDLVKKGECETVEFKISFDREAIETLAAFANTKGGTIVIGLQNSGKPGGVQLGKETLQNWANRIKLNTSPFIAPDASVITVNNRSMVILKIIEYPVKPISYKGKYFKRFQNDSKATVFKITPRKAIRKTTRKIQTREQIFALLSKNPNMTREDLARTLSKSPNTIKGHIAKLKSEGRIKRIGSDRNGYWDVILTV